MPYLRQSYSNFLAARQQYCCPGQRVCVHEGGWCYMVIREAYPRVHAHPIMSNHKIESTALVAASGYHLSLLQSVPVFIE